LIRRVVVVTIIIIDSLEVNVRFSKVQGYHRPVLVPASIRGPLSRPVGGVPADDVSFF